VKTAIVIGTIVATRKEEGLVGSKLLLTQPVNMNKEPIGEPFIAVDTVGAGIGEFVMYSTGTASRNAANKPKSSIDAAIVGIIDGFDIRTDLFDDKK
jgi:ethanolamine utilization protein EutN